MAGTLGRIEEFDGSKDDWPQYVERLEHFFVHNGITTPEKKRAVFLSEQRRIRRCTIWCLRISRETRPTANWSVR